MTKLKKSELKEVIKPIVEECITESLHKIILESGVLSTVISEVVRGTRTDTAPTKIAPEQPVELETKRAQQEEQVTKKINETKKRLMTAIGNKSYGGVDLFEGTTPAPEPSSTGRGALSDTDPNNPGVDISSIMNPAWSKLI